VCNQEVNESSSWSSTYQDKIYYFNSPECKADFDRDPGRFAAGVGSRIREKGARTASRARSRIESMISDRKGKYAESIGTVSNAFRTASQKLREQQQDAMAQYADKAAESVDRFSGYLRQHDAKAIIEEAEEFMRRRPVLVMGSAIAAGILVARFLKSSKSVSA
jgi:YHS domain-containing protein